LGKTAAAMGAEFPEHMKKIKISGKPIELCTEKKSSFSRMVACGWAK
jgi:hypothetical protein